MTATTTRCVYRGVPFFRLCLRRYQVWLPQGARPSGSGHYIAQSAAAVRRWIDDVHARELWRTGGGTPFVLTTD